MKIYILILILLAFSNCNSVENKVSQKAKPNFFDSVEKRSLLILDSLNCRRFDTSARWLLYTIQCDDSSYYGKSRTRVSLTRTPLSFFDLSLINVENNNDTLTLGYLFLYNDSTYIDQSSGKGAIVSGVVFNVKNDTIFGVIKGEGIYNNLNPKSRFANPLQAEVIAFIKNNKNKLNSWFREEAKRRKIIE